MSKETTKITHYNRSNPFLYTMEKINDQLIFSTHNLIKDAIILGVLDLIWIIVVISCLFTDTIELTSTLFILGIMLICGIFVIHFIQKSVIRNKKLYLTRKKYPDGEFTTFMNLNNEEMYQDTLQLSNQVGKVEGYRHMTLLFCAIDLLGMIMWTLRFIIRLL